MNSSQDCGIANYITNKSYMNETKKKTFDSNSIIVTYPFHQTFAHQLLVHHASDWRCSN